MDQNDIIVQLRSQGNRFLKEAADLQEKADALFKSAAILEEKVKSEADPGLIGPRRTPASAPLKPTRAQRGTRILQLKTALRFGPLSRAELQRATRIPKGTLDHLLKPGGDFEKDADGRYSMKKNPEVTSLSTKVAEIGQQGASTNREDK